MKKLGLYVHIPFCERKCNYCDFYSITKTDDLENRYVDSLIVEIKNYEAKCRDYEIDSIFIGGGTPSYLKPENIERIMQEIKNNFLLSADCEITIEANPNSIDKNKAISYKNSGVNRVSLGVQSLDNDILQSIGRLHNSGEAINAIRAIKEAGISNINVDVMFGIPNQSLESIGTTLYKIMNEEVKHISFYSLKLEEETAMFLMEKKGLIHILDEEAEREMYYEGCEIMENNGYLQYEISNFSKENYECKHNIKYWTAGEYIGLGPFAHSCFDNKRYNNLSDINLYCECLEKIKDNSVIEEQTYEDIKISFKNNIKTDEENHFKFRNLNEVLNKESMMFEYIMLGLRMNKGISVGDFNKKFETSFLDIYKRQIDKLTSYNLLILKKDRVLLSNKGRDVSNYVFEEFL